MRAQWLSRAVTFQKAAAVGKEGPGLGAREMRSWKDRFHSGKFWSKDRRRKPMGRRERKEGVSEAEPPEKGCQGGKQAQEDTPVPRAQSQWKNRPSTGSRSSAQLAGCLETVSLCQSRCLSSQLGTLGPIRTPGWESGPPRVLPTSHTSGKICLL